MINLEKAQCDYSQMRKRQEGFEKKELGHRWDWAEGVAVPKVEQAHQSVLQTPINWSEIRMLDLGCGADTSPTGFAPLFCRYVSSLGAALVVGVDKDPNDQEMQDNYYHLQINIEPDDEQFPQKVLNQLVERGVSGSFNLITSFGFAEVHSTSPELMKQLRTRPVNDSLGSVIFGLQKQRNYGFFGSYSKELFKTQVIFWAFSLLAEDGILYFGTDDFFYQKKGSKMIGYRDNGLEKGWELIETIDFDAADK